MGDFNHPEIFLKKGNMAGHKQLIRFLECVEDKFFTQVLDGLTRRVALLDMLLADKEELLKDVKPEGCTGHSNHEIVEFRILREVSKTNGITALHFRRAVFSLFRYLLGRIS